MGFNVAQLLKDIGTVHKQKESTYQGSPCTRFELAECFFDTSHTKNDACVFQYGNGAVAYKCQHQSCKERGWKDVKAHLDLKYGVDFGKYWSKTPTRESGKKEEWAPISYLSGEDILAIPMKLEWIVSGFIAQGESCLIHSRGGLGKSMFVQFVLLSIAAFSNRFEDSLDGFLGEFMISQQRVSLFIGSENGRVSAYQRLKSMCSGSNLGDGLKNIFFLSQYEDTTISGVVFLDPKFCKFLVGFIKKIETENNVKIDILCVDPLISFTGASDENNAAEMRPALDAMDGVCKQVKCTLIVIHHDKKDGSGYRGTTAINDFFRNRISLKKEFIAENRITEVGADGMATGQRVASIPVIRITHEKANNFQMFSPFLVQMDRHLHFKRIDEQLNPEDAEKANAVAQALLDMGGYAKSANALAKVYQDFAGLGKTAAKNHIKIASENGLIRRESVVLDGSQTYEYRTLEN